MVRLAHGFAAVDVILLKLLNLTKVYFQEVYRVILVGGQLGWVDLDLGSLSG